MDEDKIQDTYEPPKTKWLEQFDTFDDMIGLAEEWLKGKDKASSFQEDLILRGIRGAPDGWEVDQDLVQELLFRVKCRTKDSKMGT